MLEVQSVFAPHLGRHVKLGCQLPLVHGYAPRLRNYLLQSLPPPSPASDYSGKALPSLRNVYLNDRLGCCVVAGWLHVLGVLTGNSGNCITYTDQQVTSLYSTIGGYVPGNPDTDQGCDPEVMLNWWLKNGDGSGRHQIAGWLRLDETNPTEMMQAMELFENLLFAEGLPNAYVSQLMPQRDGFTWGFAGAPNPYNGHLFMAHGHGPDGAKIDTWALFGTHTWDAIAQYCSPRYRGAVYTVVSQDALIAATQKSPKGLNWTQMISDFDTMGGNVPIPSPVPQPPPPPGPTPVNPLWQELVSFVEYLLATYGKAALPQIEAWISKLPLPALVISAIDALLEKYLGQKAAFKYKAAP